MATEKTEQEIREMEVKAMLTALKRRDVRLAQAIALTSLIAPK